MDQLKQIARSWGTGGLLFMMVALDSVSQILSMVTDGLLAAGVLLIYTWTRKKKE